MTGNRYSGNVVTTAQRVSRRDSRYRSGVNTQTVVKVPRIFEWAVQPGQKFEWTITPDGLLLKAVDA